ncbi:MAG: class I SAM-dependent methyltransferase [Actinomycetota bacterium]
MNCCRGCGNRQLSRALDLGSMPAADNFPPASQPVESAEITHALAMDVCRRCGLAQLADDDTVTDEPRGVEPRALQEQARDAVQRVAADGWLRGDTVREFGSPHGGSWVSLLTARGFGATPDTPADVVLDSFGLMHEPDQRAAFRRRADAMAPGGVLLVQFHSLAAIVRLGQWNALRHGHFAYYSLTALARLMRGAGLAAVKAWEFDLYGGTLLVAAVRGEAEPEAEPDDSVRAILASEAAQGITEPETVVVLQACADRHVEGLRRWLVEQSEAGLLVMAYGAASRAVAVFSRARLDSALLAGVADAAPAKQGRRMPGTDIPIVSPGELLEADPDRVLLTLPDLLPEVRARFPQLDGRWWIDTGGLGGPSRPEEPTV